MSPTLIEVVPQIVALTSMLGCVGLFLICRTDWARTAKRQRDELDALKDSVQDLQTALAALRTETETRDHYVNKAAGETSCRSHLNLERREMVVRLKRSGATPHDIAAAMDMLLQEVDLVLKAQNMREF